MGNHKPDSLPSLIEPVASDKAAVYEDLVEYCEYLLVLSPEPLWRQRGKAPHHNEQQSQSRSTEPAMKLTGFSAAEMPEEAGLAGVYVTRRDGGLTYAYEANWKVIGQKITWQAIVTRDGECKGQPSGTLDPLLVSDPESAVRKFVELRIERLSEVKQ